MRLKHFLLLFFIHIIFQTQSFGNIFEYNNNSKSTLSELIKKSKPLDTILVSKKFFNESGIVIDKPLTLIGKGNPVIDANYAGGNVISVTSNNVIIIGITIRNVERANISDNAAIKISASSFCKIENCRIENAFFGIYLAKSHHCFVFSNKVLGNSEYESSSGNGIHLWQCNNVSIQNNFVSKQRDGIYFEFVKNGYIANNYSENNLRYGLHFMFSDSCQYIENKFVKNGAGVAVMYTRKVLMQNNIFENNWGPSAYGLLIKDIVDSKIINNSFINNTVGIHAEGSNRIIIDKNQFVNNGWAVRIMANCTDNLFTHNNFISNTFDISTNSRQNYSKFKNNYWSSYSGYDLNKDGIGDVPHYPVRLFSVLVAQQESSLMLLHSFFVELLDISEKILPFLTPATLIDTEPLMEVIS